MLTKIKKFKKVILPSLLIILVAVVGFCFLGNDSKTNLKTKEQLRLLEYNQVEDNEEKIDGTEYVTFDAFFLKDLDNDGEADGIRGTSNRVNSSDTLWIELKVLGDVTLKNARISFINSNVKLTSEKIIKGTLFSQTINSTNITSIPLNNIGNGTTGLFPMIVSSNITNDITSYTGQNKVILTGTVVDSEGNETTIKKEVSYTADWYGENLYARIGSYNVEYPDEIAHGSLTLTYTVETYEMANELLLKSANISGVVSDLNGIKPSNVVVQGANVTYEYDKETQTFTAKREASLKDNIITSQAYSYKIGSSVNNWTIKVTYNNAVDVSEAMTQIQLKTWYEGYSNQNADYENIVTSNEASKILPAIVPNYDYQPDGTISYNSYSNEITPSIVSKDKVMSLYQGVDVSNKTDTYNVKWTMSYNEENVGKTLYVEEQGTDKFNDTVSLGNYVKYKSMKIMGASHALGSSGYIKLINNDTKEVIHVFTALDWDTIYTFEEDVSSVSIETSKFIAVSGISINFTKEIDNQAIADNIPIGEYKGYNYILSSYKVNNNDNIIRRATTQYKESESYVKLNLSKGSFNTTEDSKTTMTIETYKVNSIASGWANGEFLIKIPSEILDVKIEEVKTNNSNVKIVSSEVKTIDGEKFIKIITENSEEAEYKIDLIVTLTPDPRKANTKVSFILYGYNPICHNYTYRAKDIYDVNDNNNKDEVVSQFTYNASLESPAEVITTTTLTNYDNDGNTAVSPMIGEVNPVEDDSSADVAIGITNNSGYAIKNIKVLGKLGFVGNTYQIGDGDLGSEFDVSMTDDGIKVPSELEGKATVYYSEAESPSDDLSDTTNGWTEAPTDFSKIKTYMIVIEDYTIYNQSTIEFKYGIKMPNTTENLFKKTYFTHGVYYDVVTNAGNYASSVGGSKLGIMMARKYDIEITDYEINSSKVISGTRYMLTDEDGNTKTISTNSNGKAILKDLYVDKEYKLSSLKIDSNYVLDEEEKIFKVTNNENDELVLTNTGTYKNIEYVANNVLKVELENEVKYTVVLKNTDFDTLEDISNSTFKITGKGYEDSYVLRTNNNGEVTLKGLYINEEYEMEQIKTNGYLILDKFKIKLIRNEETGKIQITIEKQPRIGEVTSLSSYTFNKNDSDGIVSNVPHNSTGTAVVDIDLSEFKEQYKLNMNVTFKTYGTFKAYLTDDYNQTLSSPFISTSTAVTKKDYSTQYVNNYKNNFSVSEEFVGGKEYDLYLYHYRKSYGGLTINSITIEPLDGTIEYVAQEETKNVALAESDKVLQTLEIKNDSIQPVLTVEVKNQSIPSYTLELTKKDAESGEVLAGAQYKVTGPGLPENGKYITTDEFGKATIKLQKTALGDYKAVYTDKEYEQLLGEYKVEEVVAPVGYMLDNKSVSFKVVNYIECDEKYNSSIQQYYWDLTTLKTNNYLDYLETTESEFKETEYDEATNTYKVVMYDYPLITIKKTDSETGELLPNTLFAIYNVSKVNGLEVLTPAKDVDGNIVGNKITIDGKDVYVIATDKEGKITLNLSSGQYKVKEIQAADEKYEISNQEYYFGVGETIPYQAEGGELVDGFMVEDFYFNNYYGKANHITATSDGGFILTTKEYLIKYNANLEEEWKVSNVIEVKNSQTYAKYFDDPDRIENLSSDQSTKKIYGADIKETSDGGYIVLHDYGVIIKYDKDGNRVWQNYDNLYETTYYYTSLCDFDPDSYTPPDYQLSKLDDTKYYCTNDSEYFPKRSEGIGFTTDKAGNIYVIQSIGGGTGSGTNYRYDYGIRKSDGSFIRVPEDKEYIIKYDKAGNLIDAVNLEEKLNEGFKKYLLDNVITDEVYISTNYYSSTLYIGAYEDNSLLVTINSTRISYYEDDSNYKREIAIPVVMKLDQNLNPIFTTPISIEYHSGSIYNNFNGEMPIYLTEDGGFIFSYDYDFEDFSDETKLYYDKLRKVLAPTTFTGYKEYDMYSGEEQLPDNSYWALRYDSNGEPMYATEYGRTSRNETENMIYGNNDWKRIDMSEYKITHYALEDGSYIYAAPFGSFKSSYYNEVELASGEVVNITGNYIIYKVNADSSIEWIKQYNYPSTYAPNFSRTGETIMLTDGRLLIPYRVDLTDPNTPIISDHNGTDAPLIYNTTGKSGLAFLVFDLSDEVTPEGPEAYTLNINNSRKEYKVSVTSNIGSEVKVSDGDKTIYEGLPDTDVVIEKVKYMDDNIYDIKITPEDGYVITSVKVNGEDIGYTVNDDLSITLDKIKEITEDKEIVVTMTHGLSSVVVHHYKENTTERVFSDEIITGMILTKYETSPQVSNLYSLITDDNGEYILPDNMTGTFDIKPIEVTYYYKENDVDLKVNYYINDTEIELAPSVVETKVLGARYQTSALDIEFYELAKVIGEEEGTLDSDLTEVTYFYNEVTESEITVKHIDKDTLKEIAESESFVVDRHADYETKESVNKPANYRYVSRTSNAVGKAEQQEIEVIYYYEVIPFDVEIDTKISEILINGEKGNTGDGKLAKIEPEKDDNVIVYYEITVKNTGDIKATMKIEQSEIEGFEIYDLKEFTKEEDKYIVNVELEAGEEKTYKIGYKWDQSRYGESDSETKISEVANSLGFAEPDEGDNISTTKIIVGVPTGMNLNIISIIIISIITSGMIVFMLLRRRVRN